MHDLVVRNGMIIDGTGAPARRGDIAIDGERIVAVGVVEGRGREEIDAEGLIVTPGWVDMHTHYDGQVSWDPYLTPSGWHGVTTVVMGNCGVGFAPVRPDEREWLIQVMEGVEDIPGSALSEGLRWGWETFPEYLDAIDTPHALDFATQIPHSALRGYVMGPDASERDAATPEQVTQMKELVKEALLAGALGWSTSRTSLHKTAAGAFVGGTFAPIDELRGIAEAMGETGLGVMEIADEHLMVAQDLSWMEEIATQAGRPVIFNLSQTDFSPGLWKEVLGKLEAAIGRGAPLYAQVAGRAIGIWMNWRATAHPFALHPTFKALAELPWEERLLRLRDPGTRETILAEKPVGAGMFEAWLVQAWDKMFLFSGPADYEPSPERSVGAIAKATGRPPAEVAWDALMADDGGGFLYFPLFNYTNGDLEILHGLHQNPRVLMGLSDGGAHCGAICDGGMPTFMLTHWVRDRARGGRLPLEHIVRRQTSDTAAFYGLADRGVIAPGYRADLNLIDFEALELVNPRLVHDLPAGGRRLIQEARGYKATICRGAVTFRDGVPTGALPGRLVRGPQAAPCRAEATG